MKKNVDVHALLKANLTPHMNKSQDIMMHEITAKLTKLMDTNKVSLDSLKAKMQMLLRPISAKYKQKKKKKKNKNSITV